MKPAFFTTSLLHKPERLVLRKGSWQNIPLRVRVGYFDHPELGHTLIDTGYSRQVTQAQWRKDGVLALYRRLLKPSILTPDPLTDGLARFGLDCARIDTVIITHFHADHVAGLSAIPNARVICARTGWDALHQKSKLKNAMAGVFAGLLPEGLDQRLNFVEDARLVEAPLGLGKGRDIAGDGSILAIDLPGHLEGHIGLCFAALPQPFLYAADVQWVLRAVSEDRCPGPPTSLVHQDGNATQLSVARVREFMQAGGDVLLCHEPQIHSFDVDPEVGG